MGAAFVEAEAFEMPFVKDMRKRIIITLRKGVIQSVVGVPPDVEIAVRDYDIEGGTATGTLKRDNKGEYYAEELWK